MHFRLGLAYEYDPFFALAIADSKAQLREEARKLLAWQDIRDEERSCPSNYLKIPNNPTQSKDG